VTSPGTPEGERRLHPLEPGTVVFDPYAYDFEQERLRRARRGRLQRSLLRTSLVIIVILIVHLFVLTDFVVPSGSMENAIMPGEHIVVNQIWYDFASYHRGDVDVFVAPAGVGSTCGGEQPRYMVKRVIGLPGDTVTSNDNTVYVNGQALVEPWLGVTGTSLGRPVGTVHVGPNQLFMMGDNRADSCDSRYWGVIDESAVVGKVMGVVWPLSKWHGL